VKVPGLVFSDAAIADILEQSDWYAGKAGRNLAKRWEAGVTSTLLQIARGPETGSPCKLDAEELRGTRRMAVARFPKHLIFYQVREDGILILRVVHGARDIESLFSEGGSSRS
jgi:toxin ParE1/3/4